jgi:hypothetical protein
MKGVCGGENESKLNERLHKFRSRLFENQGTHFIIHSSFFILCPCVQICTSASALKSVKISLFA